MRAALLLVLLMPACSSTTIVNRYITADAGAEVSAEVGGDVGASDDPSHGSVGRDASAAGDAGSEQDASQCAVSYVAPSGAVGFTAIVSSTYPYPCDVSCGASGPYLYSTTPGSNAQPSVAGCNQIKWRDNLEWYFCCPAIECTRRENWDQFCAGYNPGHSISYLCNAPIGYPQPTRPGCELYKGPGDSTTQFCCVD